MTLLGKIFTVLIFIMSLVFMSFAVMVYATHRNWREVVENTDVSAGKKLGLKKQLEDLEAKRREQEAKIYAMEQKLQLEQMARAQALAALTTRLLETEAKLAETMKELATAQTENGTQVKIVETASNNVAQLTKEAEILRDAIRQAQQERAAEFKVAVARTDEVNQLAGQLRDIRERNTQLTSQFAQAQFQLNKFKLPLVPSPDAPPLVEGVIAAVSPEGLVEITIGSDDGLKEGHQLEVFRRGGAYLGRIVVRRAKPDRAVGEILKDYSKGPMQPGDLVATKIG